MKVGVFLIVVGVVLLAMAEISSAGNDHHLLKRKILKRWVPVFKRAPVYKRDMDELRRMFAENDSNGDKKLSFSELEHNLEGEMSKQEIEDVFRYFDNDNDRALSFDEFTFIARLAGEI